MRFGRAVGRGRKYIYRPAGENGKESLRKEMFREECEIIHR